VLNYRKVTQSFSARGGLAFSGSFGEINQPQRVDIRDRQIGGRYEENFCFFRGFIFSVIHLEAFG
jgi:hypothetical protein